MSFRPNIYSVLFAFFCFLFAASTQSQPSSQLQSLLERHGAELVQQASSEEDQSGPYVYSRFARLVAAELEKSGERGLANRIIHAIEHRDNPGEFPKSAFAWMTHIFAREFYKDAIIHGTGELIKFKTFATEVPNRLNPEFIKQKEYLERLAKKLGLNFSDVDGYVQEIWIGDGEESFGIMSHSDVQPVRKSEWRHDPWSGEVIDEVIWGRGTIDDKGPIVAVMYGMRALLDSGIPLNKKIVLLVGTDEESANEDIATYLKTHKAPNQTIVVDMYYPVRCAEKGWCGVWLSLPRGSIKPEYDRGLLITDLQAGFSPSIVPEKANARLIPVGISAGEAVSALKQKIAAFEKMRVGARLTVEVSDDTLFLNAYGKSVHSSLPATGHNALMDLLVFLNQEVKPIQNDIALMAKFATIYIGFELDGKRLGIAHRDDFMGEVTVAADLFNTSDSTVMFMFNFRIPKGIEHTTIERALDQRFAEFEKAYGVKFSVNRYLSEPLYNDPNNPFYERLLEVYNSVTHENRKAQAIGGGTYARRIPNAVVFGPAMPDEEYLGHQPNEHIKISTLVRNIEILTHTMVEFGM